MTEAPENDERDGERPLTRQERRLLTVLALPSFGLALTITAVSAYMPVLLHDFTKSRLVIGALIGGEGVFALIVPVLVGSWSDRLRTRVGGRIPFVIAGCAVAVAAVAVVPFAGSLALFGALLAAFYAGYFVYFAPYAALFPDLVDEEAHGRSQSAQALGREVGMGTALVGGGVLLSAWQPLPFLVAAGILLAVTAVVVTRILRRAGRLRSHGHEAPGESARREVVRLLRDRADIRRVVIANSLWEFALAAIKSFAVLYIVVGLHEPASASSAAMAVVAVGVVAAAAVAGKLADRHGAARIMRIGAWVYAVGLIVPAVFTSTAVIVPVLPFAAFGAGVVMTLPYAALMRAMPEGAHGAVSGLWVLSRGVGLIFGPLLAGVAIDQLSPVLSSTQGYAALWIVASAAIFASIPVISRQARREDRPADAAQEGSASASSPASAAAPTTSQAA